MDPLPFIDTSQTQRLGKEITKAICDYIGWPFVPIRILDFQTGHDGLFRRVTCVFINGKRIEVSIRRRSTGSTVLTPVIATVSWKDRFDYHVENVTSFRFNEKGFWEFDSNLKPTQNRQGI